MNENSQFVAKRLTVRQSLNLFPHYSRPRFVSTTAVRDDAEIPTTGDNIANSNRVVDNNFNDMTTAADEESPRRDG